MKQAHNANKRRTEEPRLNIRQLVLLSSKNINVPNKAPKLKPRCLGSFPVSSTDYQCKNCGLDLTSKPELSLIYNTFHISNLKPDLQNNDNKFPLSGLSKPRPVEDDRYEVEKVLEYAQLLELDNHNTKSDGSDIATTKTNGSMQITSQPKSCKTFGPKEV